MALTSEESRLLREESDACDREAYATLLGRSRIRLAEIGGPDSILCNVMDEIMQTSSDTAVTDAKALKCNVMRWAACAC